MAGSCWMASTFSAGSRHASLSSRASQLIEGGARPAPYQPGVAALDAANLHSESGPSQPFAGRHGSDVLLNATRHGTVLLNGIDVVAVLVALEQSLQ